MRCSDCPSAMAAVRTGQGSLTLCGEKKDLWLPTFLSHNHGDEDSYDVMLIGNARDVCDTETKSDCAIHSEAPDPKRQKQ